jgi:hypothetical protein
MRCGGASGWRCFRRSPGGAGAGPDRHCGRVDRHPGLSEQVLFLLRLRWRLIADPYEEVGWLPDWGGPDSLDGEAFPDELLRFGIQFADGGRVIILDRYPFVSEDLPPDQPVLVEGGGEGSEDGPPPGPAHPGTWGWPSSPCRRPGRWPSSVPAGTQNPERAGRG